MKKAAPKKKRHTSLAAKKKTKGALPAPERKTLATKKTSKAAVAPKKKTAIAKKRGASRPTHPSRPSQRALDVSAQVPAERALTDEEREAMGKVARTALVAVGAASEARSPTEIVISIASFVDAIRLGQRQAPSSEDVRLGLGVLWGEQVRAQVGWRWVHLSYPNGFASYALVPDDRAFACFPLNRVAELLTRGADGTNTSVPLFESIRQSHLPQRRENAYLVIG